MYLITFASSCFFLSMSERKKYKNVRVLLIAIALLIPSIIAGVRDYSVGTDVLLYGNAWFEKACSYSSMYQYLMKAKEYSVGLGYAAVNYLVSRFSSSPHMFYFIYELLLLIILYNALRPYKEKINISYAFIVYYLLFFNNSLNILRQAMAIVLVLYSYKFARKDEFVKFTIVIIVAYLFHSSAIVGIVIYPICWAYSRQFDKRWIKPLVVLSSFSLICGYRLVFDFLAKSILIPGLRYEKYLSQDIIGGRYIGLVYWTIIILFLINTRQKNKNIISDAVVIETILYMSATFVLLPFLGSALLSRISFYFDVFQVLYLPVVATNLKIVCGNNKATKVTKKIVVLLPVITYWLVAFIVRNGAHTYPYTFM
ncbi:MAG: EpsG family protein [Anaerostipes hadrus]|nr:EpsG family protein [Anaerostipes hadrus]